MRQDPRLSRGAVGLRAADVRARARRRGAGYRGLQPRLLSPRAGPLPRSHRDEAIARDAQEPQAAQAQAAVPGDQDQAVLQARRRATGSAIPPRARLLVDDPRVGDRYLSAEEIAERVVELADEIDDDYDSSEPLLIAPLKASVVFLADLSR